MESFESFEEISGRKFSLGLEAGAGDIGAIVTAGTAWGPAKRDNRIDWGSGAEPGTVSPHLGLVLPGQEPGAEDLPGHYTFPSMDEIGLNLVTVLDSLRVRQVIGLGDG